MPAPERLVVNCATWGARAYQEEAETWDKRAAEVEEDGLRAHYRRQAEACRTAARNALHAAGLPPDQPAEPETRIPLTPQELEQRDRDAAAAIDHAWAGLRAHRNALLTASDWTQLQDAGLTPGERAGWDTYRRALRDLPATTTNPAEPTWPTPPAGARI